jgi:molybdopterin-guanine dinucleotide biosynthesis protein A
MWTAAILVGGRGRRLGGCNKGALDLGGERLIDRQLARVRAIADAVLIVTNETERYADLGVPVVVDDLPDAGPLGAVLTALLRAPTDQIVALACDMPFLTAAFVQHVALVGQEVDVAMPRSARGLEPLCASYRREAAEPMRRRVARGALALRDLLADVRVRIIEPDEIAPFDPDGLLFFNINTPDDYARARALAARERPSLGA